ncbi:hypothetical protein ACIQOV_31265, partial [Kitasatospora sp. NPDC091257]|uniref:DUF6197 family protein n=1 Tax=Kitasatospora sp. NPDC091257 TaxID=3364084 RepID=UPI003808D053
RVAPIFLDRKVRQGRTASTAPCSRLLHATGRPARSPDEYNDRPTTREGDVHQLLDRAAARAARLGL